MVKGNEETLVAMMNSSGSKKSKLSFGKVRAIYREFLPLGDHVFEFTAQLRNAGFRAFDPYLEFLESFCTNREELETHRKCLLERAKEGLGQPWPFVLIAPDLQYVSPFLQELREERDQSNGVPVDQINERFPPEEFGWRQEYDPAERARAKSYVAEAKAYDARFKKVREMQLQRLEYEAVAQTTELAKNFAFDKQGRYGLFKAAMERDAGLLAFQFTKSRSFPDYPLFAKQISKDWDLCWAIENHRKFLLIPERGHLEPCLELRNRNLQGAAGKADSGTVLFIRYNTVILGFGNAYSIFRNPAELEAVIRAHVFLYSCIAPKIEQGIARVLTKNDK